MTGIFISYRRDDAAAWAGRIASDLRQRFGPGAVFQDIDAIEAGEKFVAAIERALASSSAVLVLIGPAWLSIRDRNGLRRLDDPRDVVHLEVSKALQREGLRVIPVLVGGAQMPGPNDLAEGLKPLAEINAHEISDKRWEYDFSTLAQVLAKIPALAAGIPAQRGGQPDSPPRATGRTDRWFSARAVSFGAAVAAAVLAIWFALGWQKPPPAQFAIDRPGNNEVLPLAENQSWMLEGKLPRAAGAQPASGEPTIEVEVFRLPERRPIPQTGKLRVSTQRGVWSFESASFDGQAEYELVATVFMDGKSDYHRVTVQGVPKATAYLREVEMERESRGASKVATAKLDSASIDALKRQVYRLQEEFIQHITSGDLDAAQEKAVKALDLLDPVIPAYPNDKYLQNLRAYALKNYAVVMRERERPKEFERAVSAAAKMFEAIREQDPRDASAWNGLGSVALLRDEPQQALQYIERALELEPDYPPARHDRNVALEMLKRKPRAR